MARRDLSLAIPRKAMTMPSYSTFIARAAPLAALAALHAFGAQTLAAIPALPAYGQSVQVAPRDSQPVYLPATRYTRKDHMLTIDFEYLSNNAGPSRPDFDLLPVDFGELPPGNYALEARFHDIAHPEAPPQVASAGVSVAAPQDWGVYGSPQQPNAFAPVQILVNS